MINVELPTLVAKKGAAVPVRRISFRTFWLLFVVEGLLILGMLILVLNLLLPSRAPLAQDGDYATVREAVWARLNGVVVDPLIEVEPGVTARSSNVRGFTLNGETYYYAIEGKQGFDPFSRGAVDQSQIEVVLRDTGGPFPLVIYRLIRK